MWFYLLLLFFIGCSPVPIEENITNITIVEEIIEEPTINKTNETLEVIPIKKPYQFTPTIPHATKDGISLGLIDYDFEKKGDNWGKVKTIDIIIDNHRNISLTPIIKVFILEEEKSYLQMPSKLVELSEIGPFDYIETKVEVDLSLSDIKEKKEIHVILGNDYKVFQELVSVKDPVLFDK